MSNIYIQEPPTSGKVLLKTTVGDIDIELWSRECPKACRNFIQLCMEGYYNGTIFHRVVKGFIVQGGDPSGDGSGGESIYGHPFKDEFHSRLRYARRGLVGMANADKDDNGSQFFFTMAATPELQNKNTLFGKVTGDTVYNMLKLEDGLVDHNERPMYPQKILRTEILNNPFDDIVPRKVAKENKKEKNKKREKGVKNFGLLSFGVEAEEDEEETNQFVQKNAGKAKSMHDVVDDPKLSKDALRIENTASVSSDDEEALEEERRLTRIKKEPLGDEDVEERKKRIKEKLQPTASTSKKAPKTETVQIKTEISDSDEDVLMTQEQEQKIKNQKKKDEIRKEILNLKKQYQTEKREREKIDEKKPEKSGNVELHANAKDNEFIQNFIEEKEKYSSLKSKIPKKGASREDFTLSLLSKFRNKLDALKQKQAESNESKELVDDVIVEKEIQGDDWLAHTLKFDEAAPILAKDASTKGDDWYDAYDPRNPLNKRKRGEGSRSGGSSSSTKRRK
ncbi:PREDICTED: peptidyl-prolyl cis-trans isomerase CWC27 homolog [Rhagoletis zephyria]|uniref:peptidyl-prolyl cis-trans isomerase CWC27 homolog n=1 Tax=Rhagoletis zephyria TaxID=28612 RepID=UPI000811661C|nr:PREDICTED: peptidyl-prolyl cis-trans isomerase CWC27 homolog [Rhagoletis zephyria]